MNRTPARATAVSMIERRLSMLGGDQPRYTTRQEAILEAIETVFLSEGFRRCTVRDLANRVGCSSRTLYELAPTKEELLHIVLERIWVRASAHARAEMDRAPDPAAKLIAFLRSSVVILWSPWSNLMQDILAYAPTSNRFESHVHAAIGLLGDIVTEGIAIGQFHPVDATLIAEFLAAGAIRVASPDVLEQVGMDAVDAIQLVTENLLKGILVQPSHATKPNNRKG